MAETYYKYQERDQQAQINWAEVGKNFSDTLNKEAEFREKKKAAIDESTREFQKKLDDHPYGNSETIRQWALKFGASAQEVMLMQEKLLKTGQLNPSDYTVMRQNLVDGTDNAFDLIQYYQDEYAAKMERMNAEDPAMASQYLEVWLMENVEGFGDFNRSEAVINPRNGEVMAAFKKKNEKTGVMELDTNPDNMRSVSSLKGNILGKFNKYQLEKEATGFVEAQGTWEEVTREFGNSQKSGLLRVISDPMKKNMSAKQLIAAGEDPKVAEAASLYFESEEGWITAQMTNGYNTSSVLTDYVGYTEDGSKYAYTYDTEKAKENSNLILLENDSQGRPNPVFTDEQKEAARDYMKTSIRSKINKTVKAQGMSDYNRPSESEYKRKDEQREAESVVSNFSKLWSGNNEEVLEAENYLRSVNPNIRSIDRDGESVEVTFKDGSKEIIKFTDDTGNLISQESFIKGNVNKVLTTENKITDVNETLKKSGYNSGALFNETSTGFSAGTTADTKETIDAAYERLVREIKPPENMIIVDDESASVPKVQTWMATIPNMSGNYFAREAYAGGTDAIEIVDTDNKVVTSIQFDDKPTTKQLQDFYDSIYELAIGVATIEQKAIKTQNKRQIISGTTPTSNKSGGTSR